MESNGVIYTQIVFYFASKQMIVVIDNDLSLENIQTVLNVEFIISVH